MRIVDIRSVTYGWGSEVFAACARGQHAEWRCVSIGMKDASNPLDIAFDPFDERALQHFVCGLRQLIKQPLRRAEYLWRRAAMIAVAEVGDPPTSTFDALTAKLVEGLKAAARATPTYDTPTSPRAAAARRC